MQVIRGTVANIRHSTEVSGNDKSVSTSQVAVFDLDGQAVEIKLMESIVLSNGDSAIVAGDTKRGLFRGMAYRNETRRVDGKVPEDPAFYRDRLDQLWDLFGEDRLIYGSDWPNSDLWAEYPKGLRVVREYFMSKGTAAAEKYFWKNSVAAYKWVKRDNSQPQL